MSLPSAFVLLIVWAWVVSSTAALGALISRGRPARMLGVISMACLVGILALIFVNGVHIDGKDSSVFLLSAITAVLAMVIKPISRIPRGHCTACGYNLTGNTTGVCPECGGKVPQSVVDVHDEWSEADLAEFTTSSRQRDALQDNHADGR